MTFTFRQSLVGRVSTSNGSMRLTPLIVFADATTGNERDTAHRDRPLCVLQLWTFCRWNIPCSGSVPCLRPRLPRRRKPRAPRVNPNRLIDNSSPSLSAEFLQPYKSRPQTSSLTANRRICAALGLKNPMSNDKAKTERQKIETARRENLNAELSFERGDLRLLEQKVRDKEEQKTVWDGGVLPSPSSS